MDSLLCVRHAFRRVVVKMLMLCLLMVFLAFWVCCIVCALYRVRKERYADHRIVHMVTRIQVEYVWQ